LVLCTNGPAELDSQARALLAKLGIELRETALKRVEGKNGTVRLHFIDGTTLDRRALFFHAPRTQSSDLAQQLGCEMSEEKALAVNAMGQTTVPGVYAAGDLAHPAGLPFPPAFVIVAAAQGAIAGGAIDRDLLTADLGLPQPAQAAPGAPKAA
jgi:thioredoxin reductase